MNWIATHKQQQEQVQSMWRAMLVYHDSHLSVFAQQQMFRSLVAMKVIAQIKYPPLGDSYELSRCCNFRSLVLLNCQNRRSLLWKSNGLMGSKPHKNPLQKVEFNQLHNQGHYHDVQKLRPNSVSTVDIGWKTFATMRPLSYGCGGRQELTFPKMLSPLCVVGSAVPVLQCCMLRRKAHIVADNLCTNSK